MAEANETTKTSVAELRKRFSVKEDENLAYMLQNKEFETYYDYNQQRRRTIRKIITVDKNVAKEMDKEEKEKLNKSNIKREIQDNDVLIAKKMTETLIKQSTNEKRMQELADEEYAKQLHNSIIKESQKVQYRTNLNTNNLSDRLSELAVTNENNPEYIRRLREEQDIEIAKYYQDLENRKSTHRKTIPCDQIMYDEELARSIQEEEKLYQQALNNKKHSKK